MARRGSWIASGNCILALSAAVVMLVADIIALGWVGMWQALAAKELMSARSRTLSLILFVPWTLLILAISGGAILATQYVALHDLSFRHLLALWFVLGLGNDVAFGYWARRVLLRRFRILAGTRPIADKAELPYQPQTR